ncbi:hypothetical protein [Geobacter sp.]|uniref:hypothetical protein n=1 Tax=Geobacter sp. TaxID=46610 RepID=UPI001AC0FBC0|nr:hypothetical protein [Geobacter sp.]CAG0947100.1 hypothetical protein ANRL1_03669 [Anaerolineae bacterium]
MRRLFHALAMMLSFAAWAVAAEAFTYSFSTVPTGGDISGTAGSTIGWGYTITNNDSTNWLMTTGLSAGVFQKATPDGSLFDLPVLPPSASVTVPYDGIRGLYALTLDTDAPFGLSNSGIFSLSADWYAGDPLGGGTFLEFAADATAAYSAVVTDRSNQWSFQVPAADLAAPAGSSVVWRYIISNPDPINWLMMTEISAGLFVKGVPDGALFDLPLVAPSTAVTGDLYSFLWDADAVTGDFNGGIFTLNGEWWDGDPFNGGRYLEGAPERSVWYSVEAEGGAEPIPYSGPQFQDNSLRWCLR